MTMEWITQTLGELAGSPVLQGVAAALCTFVLEDPTTVGCGLLVAAGAMPWWSAFLGLFLGIAVGDFGLYLLGRQAGNRLRSWKWMDTDRLEAASVRFQRSVTPVLVGARFLPGMRLPVYTAAGALRVPAWKFLLVAVCCSLVWTTVLLTVVVHAGTAALERLGPFKWPAALAVVGLLAWVQWRSARRRARKARRPPPPVSWFEFWPPWLFYLPVGLYYLWLSIRHGSPTLPSAVNPAIYSGGLIMESKSQILSLVGREQRQWIAPWTVFLNPGGVPPQASARAAVQAMEQAGVGFPVVAKPDVGQRGAGIQPLEDEAGLARYLAQFPAGERCLLQALARGREEAGLFYVRPPGREPSILSVTRKRFPSVIGDGRTSLRQLILRDPRAGRISRIYFERLHDKLDTAPADGEVVPLVFAGNHCQGAVFQGQPGLATPGLLARLHAIALSMPEFHAGRFDVRFDSEEELMRGEGFQIVEINGAGSEATHIWDARAGLLEAYRALFGQWRLLFEIGAANRRRGYRPMGMGRILRDIRTYLRKAEKYPPTL